MKGLACSDGSVRLYAGGADLNELNLAVLRELGAHEGLFAVEMNSGGETSIDAGPN